jgi:hypothetical protein
MLQIDPKMLTEVEHAQDPADLYDALQSAIELEHATIPLYMTAMLSIKSPASGSMPLISSTIKQIMMQEMLHMNIASNVLNAIGGQPSINHPGFIPTYPGRLPMVGNFDVHLAPLSLPQLDVFLEIEEPETPIDFPVETLAAAPPPPYKTIGALYAAIMSKLKEFGQGAFKGDPARQLVGEFSGATAIKTVDDALAGLTLIVDQGEGTESSPLGSPGGTKAHYYRFMEIKKGLTLNPDPKSPKGYSYGNPPIVFDQTQILEMVSDPRSDRFSGDALKVVRAFNVAYRGVLDNLHQAFNGNPDSFDSSTMSVLVGLGREVVSTKDPVLGKYATPSFEYVP